MTWPTIFKISLKMKSGMRGTRSNLEPSKEQNNTLLLLAVALYDVLYDK
jgi:hypothetical protein